MAKYREDLMNLTLEDLATLSNRGTVKRVQKELEDGTVVATFIDEDKEGNVTIEWADGNICELPHDTALQDCQCNCPATGVCRHLVQSVIAYQAWAMEKASKPIIVGGVWNPGDIADDTLGNYYQKQALTRLRAKFDEYHVFELIKTIKPVARIHTLSCTVRFLVPDDPRYVACDCAEAKPCSHVPLAIWAFRELEQREAGLIETGKDTFTTPTALLDEMQTLLHDILEVGFAGASGLVIQRLKQLARRAREEGLFWHAVIIDEVTEEYERYTNQDARFSANQVVALIGELLIRMRTITNRTHAVPTLFIRGSSSDTNTNLDTIRLVGLGCEVQVLKGITNLNVYFQDDESGHVTVIQKQFPHPKDGAEPQTFTQMGKSALHGSTDKTFSTASENKWLFKDCRRTAESQLILTKTSKMGPSPSDFKWENLKAPLLAESFAEVRARHSTRPPASLRPRRSGETLQVVAVASVEQVVFDVFTQSVKAVLVDSDGDKLLLMHPYTSRGSEGVDSLLHHLDKSKPKFVCGQMRPGGVITPISLVFEDENQKRFLVQPWVDKRPTEEPLVSSTLLADQQHHDPLIYYPERVQTLLGELLLNGLRRASDRTAEQWHQLMQEGQQLGFVRFVEPLHELVRLLEEKQHTLQWDWRSAAEWTLEAMLLTRFAQETMS